MYKSSLKDALVKSYDDIEESVESYVYEKWHIRLHKRAKHHVHRLRKKPDHHKDVIAFSVAFVVTLCVFTAWYFISFPKIINSYALNKKENTALDVSQNPFDDIKKRVNTDNIVVE